MAVTHSVYEQGHLGMMDGSIDWDGATNIAAVLLTGTYTPDLNTHSTYADLTNEVADSDYSPVAITARSISNDAGIIRFRGSNADFGTNVSITAQYMVFIQGDPTALTSTDRIISLHDFGQSESSVNSDFRIEEPTNGWFASTEV